MTSNQGLGAEGPTRDVNQLLREDELTEAILGIREDKALTLVDESLRAGAVPAAVLTASHKAMTALGERFASGEAFLPELIMAGNIMRAIADKVGLLQSPSTSESVRGVVVLGTVKGDVHDIGKDIVGSMLGSAGFRVIDLGVDVDPQAFVAAIRDNSPSVVGLSCLLTTGFDAMRAAVGAIAESGLRETVRVMIGGAPVDEVVSNYVGADGWGTSASAAIKLAAQWSEPCSVVGGEVHD
jgi:methanogenic corrinoid protein MtbC1